VVVGSATLDAAHETAGRKSPPQWLCLLRLLPHSQGRSGQPEDRANAFAANVLPVVRQIQATGATTFRAIAAALNDRAVRTARDGAWHDSTVRNLLARAG
jgi:hypothetical protein